MPSRTLWNIPDPADLARRAKAEHDYQERQEQGRKERVADRRAKARRDAALLREQETRLRMEESRRWRVEHPPPTKQQLADLLEQFPNLKEKIEK